MDLVAAIALASGAAGRAVAAPALRSQLPALSDVPLGDDANAVAIAAEAAGLAVATTKVTVAMLRPTHCPFVCRDAQGTWHTVVEIAHGGLAVALQTDGSRTPITLGTGKRIEVHSLAAMAGPARSNAPEAHDPFGSFRLGAGIWLPVVLATLAINVLALAIPLATMNIFDRVISNGAFETLWALALGVALALVFDFTLRSLRASVLDRGSARADVLTLTRVFGRILEARMSARTARIGVQANGLREYETVREYFNSAAVAALGDLPFVALFLLVIWAVAGPLVIVPLVAVPLFLATALLIQLRLRRIVEGGFEDTAHKNAVATETLAGIESIKLAGGEAWAAGRWERAVASQLRHSLAVRFWTNLSLHLITLFPGATTIAILVAGVYLVTAGTITPGALFAANLLAARCLGPLVAVSALVARFTQVRLARRAVKELASLEPERAEGRSLVMPAPFANAISLEGVGFSYASDSPAVLHDVSLTVRPGERIAIIGGIGSGKSTLLKLIAATERPTAGRVTIDAIATTDLDPQAWRAQLGASPQVPSFVAGTVRDNVALGRPLPDAALLEAVALSGAEAWLAGTGLGLDTPVGEGGSGLSGGQLQTLAVARALAGRPRVLLLDEPTSHLDGRTEAAFAARLAALDATTVVVTHRPALIEAAERLIVMEAGRVLLDGPRADVLAKLRGVVEGRKAA